MAGMAQGTPRGRLAGSAAAAGVGAAVLAGVASVAVQAGTVVGYALFAVLLAGALVLAASAVRLFTRARAAR